MSRLFFIFLAVIFAALSSASFSCAQDSSAEARVRMSLDVARAISGVTNLGTSTVILHAPLPGFPGQLPPLTPIFVLSPGNSDVRIINIVPENLVIPFQRQYETYLLSRITLIDSTRRSLTTNLSPSVGVSRASSDVMVPVMPFENLRIQQITVPSFQVPKLR